MQKAIKIKCRWFVFVIMCLMSFTVISLSGCVGKTKTSTVTTQTTNETSGSGNANSVTTQTEKEVVTDARPRGVIGGIFYTIGQVLIWPFKAIGSLFS